ncbi:MAG: DUF4382 domain-containing protein [Bacteroidales bacterium]
MKYRLFVAGVAALLGAIALACGGNNNSTGSTQTGTLSIAMKDSPFSDAKALFVTFSEVSVHMSGGEWKTLPFAGGASSRTCDLKKLTNAQDVLGTGPLAAGHYTDIRLIVSSATIYFDNASAAAACAPSIAAPAGTSAAVTIPSGTVQLNRQFDVPAGGATTILLDFDGDKSVDQLGNGNYRMSPVITVVSVQ